MTAPVPEMTGNIGPWQRYITREHAARDAYIATTQRASREYLTGPWPDRDSYRHVEESAWRTYYAAGRQAWITYTAELTPPPPPPGPAHDNDPNAWDHYTRAHRPAFTPDPPQSIDTVRGPH